ncbi:MAG: class I SAM-dependent methyltransferase [Myxococcota bacterium]
MTRPVGGASQHYAQLLAAHYTWMSGDFDEKVAEQEALLRTLGVPGSPGGTAVDLGAGSGFQSVALARLGYRVVSVDDNAQLLEELTQRKGARDVRVVRDDLRRVASLEVREADVVVCMGDTLTHLDTRDDVTRLFHDVLRVLRPGGLLVLTFRDLTTELRGVDRFIPVRSDADRIMTCFLEYEPETVVVHDLIHVRTESGWTLHRSSYRKLRLATTWVKEQLEAAGFHVLRHEAAGRLWAVVAQRP